MKLIMQFVEDFPSVSQRQLALKFSEVTTKDRPECLEELKEKKGGRQYMV